MESKTFGSARLTFDDRFLPVVVVTFSGTNNLEACRWFAARHTEVMRAALNGGERIVLITDARRVVRPSPEVRRFFAEWSSSIPPELHAVSLGSVSVVDNPPLRGALTAVSWISARARKVVAVPTMEEAVALAFELLDAAGVPRPVGLRATDYDRSFALP